MRHPRFPFARRDLDQERPIPFDEFLASQEMRDESWRRRFAMDEQFSAARPGRGHRALASLYRAGKVPAVITQNIDNLHQASGIAAEHVVELHGNTTYAPCLDCAQALRACLGARAHGGGNGARPIARTAAATSRPRPFVRPGDARCRDAARGRAHADCDLFLAIGSSLVVWPAAGFPLMAKRNGARLVIINREATEFDDMADLVVREDIGTVLEPFIVH